MSDPLLLPPGCRLVHIGPHKTGTTAVQWALHHARERLHQQDVHYAHRRPQAYKPAIALTGLKGRIGGPQVDDKPWRRLVAEVEAEQDRRVVISSESFSNAARAHIERLADDLGRDRVHIVRMLRRYDKMLPSQWQQSIAAGGHQPFDSFLEKVFADPRHRFWRRHGFADLTRRWAEVLGPENVTTVVVDEGDHEWLLRVFERMVGLAEGTLHPQPDRSNRSLTRGEVEVLRQFNQVRKHQGWADRVHFNYVRLAASPAMRLLPPDPEGGRIAVPAALRPMLVTATERDLEALAGLGVRVVGDTELLRPPPAVGPSWGEGTGALPTVAVAGAAAAVTGVVERVEEHGPFPLRKEKGPRSAAPPVGEVPHDHSLAVPPLPRRAELYVVAPPGLEGERLRRRITAAADVFAAAKHRCRVVDRLDEVAGRRSHVVLVAMPPRQLLAGLWHEHVLARGGMPFDTWQEGTRPPSGELPRLTREAADRWGDRRVSVLVADCFAPERSDGTLAALGAVDPADLPQAGASRALMSWSEATLVRRLDEVTREHSWDDATWERYVRDGVLPWLLSAPPARLDQGLPLDEEAAGWVRRESGALVEAVTESGVRVLGDLGRLGRTPKLRPDPREPRIRPGVAALALAGAVAATDGRR